MEDTRVVFHFNKKHNEDPATIPPWVVKAKGQSFYVHHMTIDPGVGFTTKETPDSSHTKAALQVKGTLTISEIDGRMEAYVS
jgi:hypothetical protein